MGLFKTDVYGIYTFKTPFSGDVQTDYGKTKNTSGNSNREQIVDRRLGIMRDLKKRYDIDIQDGNNNWTNQEIQWIDESLASISEKVWRQQTVKNIIRFNQSGSQGCAGRAFLQENLSVTGCHDGNNTLYVFNLYISYGARGSKYGNDTSVAQGFKINLVHEIAHGYHNNNQTLLNNFCNISWQNGNIHTGSRNCDFITGYATSSAKEDFAETYGVYYFKPAQFQTRYNSVCTDNCTLEVL